MMLTFMLFCFLQLPIPMNSAGVQLSITMGSAHGIIKAQKRNTDDGLRDSSGNPFYIASANKKIETNSPKYC